MQWKKAFATAIAAATLCALVCVVPLPAHAQNAACVGKGAIIIGASPDGKKVYFSSWEPLPSQKEITLPQFFVAKAPHGKPKQLINLHVDNSRSRVIMPAPCNDTAKWSSDHQYLAFCNTDIKWSLGVWVYTLSKNGGVVLSTEWIGPGSSPRWTENDGLVYLDGNGKIGTRPAKSL